MREIKLQLELANTVISIVKMLVGLQRILGNLAILDSQQVLLERSENIMKRGLYNLINENMWKVFLHGNQNWLRNCCNITGYLLITVYLSHSIWISSVPALR